MRPFRRGSATFWIIHISNAVNPNSPQFLQQLLFESHSNASLRSNSTHFDFISLAILMLMFTSSIFFWPPSSTPSPHSSIIPTRYDWNPSLRSNSTHFDFISLASAKFQSLWLKVPLTLLCLPSQTPTFSYSQNLSMRWPDLHIRPIKTSSLF